MLNAAMPGGVSDRRHYAQSRLGVMAQQPGREHPAALREIAAGVLGFDAAAAGASVAVAQPERSDLPDRAAAIATLSNEFGPDFTALHFDLSAVSGGRQHSYVTNARIQAANAILQQYAGGERYPLLLFTLPDNSGLQFVTGAPVPGNRYRLQEVRRATAYWNTGNRTILDCLETVGNAIAHDRNPQRAFRDGFDVQPVTDQFFADYKRVYDDTARRLAEAGQRQDAEQFTQTLFNRLLFIQFISRKGWLSIDGNPDYLNALWSDYRRQAGRRSNFHADRLAILFHEGMNTPEGERRPDVAGRVGQVPFLNGGLFERNELDGKNIVVPDDAIAEIIGPGGLFNRYNFTVMEATPLDTEVAVDPEMLGKLFEETVNERHSNGAYYTPRPVVAFMCREALKGYLGNRQPEGLSPEQIAALVDNGDAAAVTAIQAAAVAIALGQVKALDPACGSGAFLLGMMQEIMAINGALFRAGAAPASQYRQKLDIIRRNLHGADQDVNAVHIAMLRLWLSLAVEYDGDDIPPPLPNLDLKLVAGNALTDAAPDAVQQDIAGYAVASARLGQLVGDYTDANAAAEKAQLKEQIAAAKADIRRNSGASAPAGAVEWRVDFADVYAGGGFDIVIANPPYVRQEEIQPPDYKDRLIKAYSAAAVKTSDLYCYFYARALQLLKPGGMQVFVCSNSWLDVGYGAKLQEYLLDNATVTAIYESAVERQFSTAAINTVISVIRRGQSGDEYETRFIRLLEEFDNAVQPYGQKRIITKTAAELRAAGTDPEKVKPANRNGKGGHSGYVGDKWGGKHLRGLDIYHYLQDQYGHKLVRLGDVSTVRFGIKTGVNDFFYLTPEIISEWGIEPEFRRPVMTSPQESRGIVIDPNRLPRQLFMCHRDKAELTGTRALTYIEWGEAQGHHRIRSVSSRPRWYDLGSRGDVPLGMNNLVGNTAYTYFATPSILFTHNFQIFRPVGEPENLCAAMNSTPFQLVVGTQGIVNYGGGVLRVEVYETKNLRIVNPAQKGRVDDSIFSGTEWDVMRPSDARRRLDTLVYDALGLTAGEREAVYEGVRELVENRKRKAGSV